MSTIDEYYGYESDDSNSTNSSENDEKKDEVSSDEEDEIIIEEGSDTGSDLEEEYDKDIEVDYFTGGKKSSSSSSSSSKETSKKQTSSSSPPLSPSSPPTSPTSPPPPPSSPSSRSTETRDIQDDDDDSNYEEDINENYLQKMEIEMNKSYINQYHPECINHNYNEINTLSKIIRDGNNNIVDPFHKTLPFLTKYEKTRVIGMRANQINNGAPVFIKVPENIIDGYIIAEMELKEKKIPFIIRRPLNNGGFEYWNLRDLEILI